MVDDKPASLLTGRVLAGRYRLVRLIGSGGMGAVYEAVQEGLGRRVAVKVLHKTRLASANAVARFRAEAETAARIGSPHIVLVTDFQANPNEPPFLVMELLEGKSLRQVIADQGVLSWQRASAIGAQILAALSAAHAAKIVHRDIKPDNVFVTPSPALGDFVKVLDFGVAKLMLDADTPPITGEGVIVGTPQYMAPEQIAGTSPDARTDLYAVGVCLYESTTGHLPIEATDSRTQLDDILHRAPLPLDTFCPDADPRFVAVVSRALAKDPAARFQSADEMAAALAAVTSSLDLQAPANTLPQRRADSPTKDEDADSLQPVGTQPIDTTLAAGLDLEPAPRPPLPVVTPNVAPVLSVPPAPKQRSRGCLWIGLILAGIVAFPVVIVVAFFAYYMRQTSVCDDAMADVDQRLSACTFACGHDPDNVQYCTVRGDILLVKGDTNAAATEYDGACKAGDKTACTKLTTLRTTPK
jgi:serine/threonine protein kinase